jgi:hypothetical protein
MNLSIILFLIGILGFILNRKNIILLIISIEIMLLAVNKANPKFIFCNIPLIITYLLAFCVVENIFNISLDSLNLELYTIATLTSSAVLIKPWQVTL